MTHPTPGRVVWFYRNYAHFANDEQPLAATVACVNRDRTVNLTVHDYSGDVAGKFSVPFIEDAEDEPLADETRAFATWMPYQRAQAAKPDEPRLTIADVQKIVSELLTAREASAKTASVTSETHFAGNGSAEGPPSTTKLDLTAIAKGGK